MNPTVILINQFGIFDVSSFRIEDNDCLVNNDCVIHLTNALYEIFGEECDSINLEECYFILVDGYHPEITIGSKGKNGTTYLRLVSMKGHIRVFR